MEHKTTYSECAKRIAVLLGGDSPEREVSLRSGVAVAEALEQFGHQTRQIDIASVDLRSLDWSAVDVAFIALHGGAGENGQVQDLLEAVPIPYTGSGPRSSRRAFSKSAAKECFHEAGVPTPDYVLIHRSDSITRLRSMAGLIGFPLVIKPDQQGSSLGVRIVHSPDELIRAATLCFDFGPFGLMERAITGGGEWTLGIVDSQPLPLMKITPRSEFFDFSAKYEDDETGYTFDFQEPEAVTQQIVRTGLSACRALATDGIARVLRRRLNTTSPETGSGRAGTLPPRKGPRHGPPHSRRTSVGAQRGRGRRVQALTWVPGTRAASGDGGRLT